MRKVIVRAAFLAAVLSLAALAGCGGSSGSSSPVGNSARASAISGSGTFSQGPDAGSAIHLQILAAVSGTTTGGGTDKPLTGSLFIAHHESIGLSGSTYPVSSGQGAPLLTGYTLTGTDRSTGTTYMVAGEGSGIGPDGVTGDATVTSSTGDSGTINLQD